MAATFVAASTLGAVSANPPSVNITLPALQADDCICIMQMSKNIVVPANEHNTPSGYTEKGTKTTIDSGTAADDMRTAMYFKRAVAGDSGATVTCSRAGTSTLGFYAIAYVYRGVDWGGANDPFDAAGVAINGDITADTDIDFPAFDPAPTRHVIYFGWHADDGTATPADLVNGGFTFTFRNEQESAVGTDCTAMLWSADHDGTALGAIAKSFTSTAGSSIGYVFALIPSSGVAMNAEPGSYAVTGAAISESRDVPSNAEPGSYALTGFAIDERRNVPINAEPGSYALTGFDATTIFSSPNVVMIADPGSYALTGADIGTLLGRVLVAEPGIYALVGFDATTAVYSPIILVAEPGSYVVTGFDAEMIAPADDSSILEGGWHLGERAGMMRGRILTRLTLHEILCGRLRVHPPLSSIRLVDLLAPTLRVGESVDARKLAGSLRTVRRAAGAVRATLPGIRGYLRIASQPDDEIMLRFLIDSDG